MLIIEIHTKLYSSYMSYLYTTSFEMYETCLYLLFTTQLFRAVFVCLSSPVVVWYVHINNVDNELQLQNVVGHSVHERTTIGM